jgi:hypothetical protein
MTRLTTAAVCMAALTLSATAAAADKKTNFEEHVLPVLRAHCGSCHNANKAKGDVNLLSYAAVMKGGSSGNIVDPGNPDASKLYKVTAHLEEPKMPPSGSKIPDKDLGILKAWIEDGLIENPAGKAKTGNKPKMNLALAPGQTGKPTGPVAEPKGDWLLEPFVKLARPSLPYSLATSPWAPIIAVGAPKQVLLYNSNSFDLVGVLPFPEGIPNVVRFSRNGSLLLAGGGQPGKSGKVVLWNVTSGERVAEIGDEPDAVLAADVSADQTLVALGGSGKLVKIYSLKDGELLHTMKKHTEWVFALEFSPDGVLLASADRNGGLVVWESGSGREFYTLNGHTAAINALSWRADSNILATGSEDTTIRLWEMINGTQVKSWGGHGGGVLALHVTHDGRIASAGRDKVVKVWTPDGNAIKQMEGFNDLAMRTTFTHDGAKVVGADWSGTVRAWTVADAKRAVEFTTNPPTLADRVAALTKEGETKKAELAALDAALKTTTDGLAALKSEQAAAQKAVADAAAEANAAAAKVAESKALVDRTKQEVEAVKTQLPGKMAAMTGLGQNAQVVKDALAAAVAHEKAIAALDAAQTAAQTTMQDLTVKAKAAGDKLAADAGVKSAFARSAVVKQTHDAGRDAFKKSLGEAAQMVKELTEASARHNQSADKAAAEVAAMQKALDEKQKALPTLEAQMKAATDAVAKVAEKKKAADAAMAAVAPKQAAAEKAVADATAKRAAAAQRIAALPAEIARLQRARKFANVFKSKADLDAKTAAATKASDAATAAKTTLEKAKLEATELAKNLPAMEADAAVKAEFAPKAKLGLDAMAKEVADLKAQIAAKEAAAKQASAEAEKAKAALAKKADDKAAKELMDKSLAAAKAATDGAAPLKATLAPKEAALVKMTADYAAVEKAAADAQKALVDGKAKRETLAASLPKMEQEATALAAAAAKATASLESAKGLYAQAAGELAKVTAN